jgi:hypothetical protein
LPDLAEAACRYSANPSITELTNTLVRGVVTIYHRSSAIPEQQSIDSASYLDLIYTYDFNSPGFSAASSDRPQRHEPCAAIENSAETTGVWNGR